MEGKVDSADPIGYGLCYGYIAYTTFFLSVFFFLSVSLHIPMHERVCVFLVLTEAVLWRLNAMTCKWK